MRKEILKTWNESTDIETFEDEGFIIYNAPHITIKFCKYNNRVKVIDRLNHKRFDDSISTYLETSDDFSIFSLECLGDMKLRYQIPIGLLEIEFFRYILCNCYCNEPVYQ